MDKGGLARFITVRKVLLMASGVMILAGLVILWWAGMSRPYVEDDFLYSADIATSDNTYDGTNQRYRGDRYSKGTVTYTVESYNGSSATVQSALSLAQSDGSPVARIMQARDVATEQGTYLPAAADEPLLQYMFAPRNLQPGQSFVYRHVAYSTPATMLYQGSEELYGLEVYRYAAAFPDDRLIREDYLPAAQLPPDQTLGIVPRLEIWVEPATGWLVKFEDNGEVVRFDRQSLAVLGPHSRYQTHYTDASILQQIAYARSLKYRQNFATNVAPALIGCLAVGGTLIYAVRRTRGVLPVRILTAVIMAVSAVAAAGWIFEVRPLMAVFIGHGVLHPLSIVCFILVALCILLIHWQLWRWLVIVLASIVIAVGLGGLLGSAYLTESVLDLALHQSTINTVDLYQSSRLSAFAAATLALLGVSILKLAISTRPLAVRFASFGFGVVLTLGVIALLLQLLHIDQPLSVSFVGPLSAATSVLFILSAYALLVVARECRGLPITPVAVIRPLLQPALLCVPLLLIGLAAQVRQNAVQTELQTAFVADIAAIQSELKGKVELYRNTLNGIRALYASSAAVSKEEWQTFIAFYNIKDNLPGMRSIGIAEAVQPASLNTFIADQRAHGSAAYAVFPTGNQPVLTPVLHVESGSAAARKEIGHNLFADDARRAAMKEARDHNTIAVTEKLELGSISGGREPGMMMVAPIYENGKPAGTAAERQAAIGRYVFTDIAIDDFMSNLPTAESRKIDLRVYDGTQPDAEHLLYDSRTTRGGRTYTPRLITTVIGSIAGRPIAIAFQTQPDYRLSGIRERAPGLILVFGSVVYLLILAGAYSIYLYRRRAAQAWEHVTALRQKLRRRDE